MKQSKRKSFFWAVNFTALVLSTGLLMGLLIGCPQNGASYGDTNLSIFKTDGNGCITGYTCKEEELPADLVIPDKIGNEVITGIDSNAFYECKKLTSIRFPQGLTSIGYWSFYGCENLTSVKLPSKLKFIGGGIFGACKNLKTLTVDSTNENYISEDNIVYTKNKKELITAAASLSSIKEIPETVTLIKHGAFSGFVNLSDVKLPSLLESIEDRVFEDCVKLASIELPAKLKSIGSSAFEGCKGLTKVNLPSMLIKMDGNIFLSCKNLKTVTVAVDNPNYKAENSIVYTKNGKELLFAAPAAELNALTIPESVNIIAQEAFDSCVSLTGITFPQNLSEIGSWAFYNCENLTSVNFPASLTKINTEAFLSCENLKSAVFANKSGWVVYDDEEYKKKYADIKQSDLENTQIAARYLLEEAKKGGYCKKYWKKN